MVRRCPSPMLVNEARPTQPQVWLGYHRLTGSGQQRSVCTACE